MNQFPGFVNEIDFNGKNDLSGDSNSNEYDNDGVDGSDDDGDENALETSASAHVKDNESEEISFPCVHSGIYAHSFWVA